MPFVFQDFETQSNLDLPVTGTMRYVLDPSTRALLWSWCIDEDPVKLWCPDLSGELVPEVWAYVKSRMAAIGECPVEIVKAMQQPGYYEVGWNEGFDRAVRQQVVTPDHGWPRLEIEQTLDAMAQAQASNLPGKLDWAGRKLGLGNKTVGGTGNMLRFARRQEPLPGSPADIDALMAKGHSRARAIEIAIEAWDLYLTYSVQDTDLLRAVWKTTRPLDAQEWRQYWDNEHINDRGMPVDVEMAKAAILYREEEARFVEEECKRLTKGQIAGPTLTKQINEWVFERLSDDLAETMVKERDAEGYVTRLTGSKNVMTQLLEDIHLSDSPPEDDVIDLLELLQYGRSSSSVKFEKIVNQEVDGRLYGSYVFNGAGQTGRGSSRGVQVHNLVRDAMPNELDVMDMIVAGAPIEKLRHLPISKREEDIERAARGQTPVSTVLSRLIRPTFTAPPGRMLVWGDWSAIEARVMPWLANSRAAEQTVLDPYRNGEDIYILNAAAIFKRPIDEIEAGVAAHDRMYSDMRQAGKISQLSLQFAGSVGAYKAMARGYRVRVTNEEAQLIVDGWRERNGWARAYWNKCDEAANHAMNSPMQPQKAGRLTFTYYPDLMGGTLVTTLPCGRPLVYPMARYEKIERFGKQVDALTYLNGMGRSVTYGGKLGQNGCQAAAASMLRDTVSVLEDTETAAMVIGHTHDEVVCEVDEAMASSFSERLESVMVAGLPWSEGLPLAAEITSDFYYHK